MLVLCLASCCFGTDWYVRPDGGDYGGEDGTTYADAWDGLLEVVWGGEGVVAGDTLYVCGLHIHNYISGGIEAVADITPVSGADDDTRVTIRGDYPSDEGIIWQAYILQDEAWTDKGSNVWQNRIPGSSRAHDWFEDITATSWTLMDLVSTSATLTGTWTFTNGSPTVTAAADGNAQAEVTAGDFVDRDTPDVYYEVQSVDNDNQLTLTSNFIGETGADAADAATFNDISAGITTLAAAITASYFFPEGLGTNDDIYVSCADDADPTGRISGNRYGYDFRLNGLEYITFLNLSIYAPYRWLWFQPANHIRWEGCTLAYGEHSLITFFNNSDYMEVIDCDLSIARNGIYTISAINDAPSNYTFSGNYIHGIGVRETNQNSDAHGIGIQGGHDGLIEKNYIVNAGNALLLYTFQNQELTDTIIRYNYVKDTHQLGGTGGYGITLQTDNRCISNRTGNEIYGNIVENASAGYRTTFIRDLVKFYNNLAIICGTSFVLGGESFVIDFDSGTTDFVKNYVVTGLDSGASATVKDISQQTGSSPNINGTISIKDRIGEFIDNEELQVDSVTYALADGTNYKLFGNIEMRNSISFNPDSLHIAWFDENDPLASLVSEYNLFWPDTGTKFDDVHGGDPVDFAGWQGKGWDVTGSAIGDPKFISSNRNNFRLSSDSPAIDAGVDVGLTEDYIGTIIPQNGVPDIGAYEYIQYLLAKLFLGVLKNE